MTTYLRKIAEEIRAYVPPDAVPGGDDTLLFDVYAVLALACGSSTTSEDVHNAWVAWMTNHDADHDSLVPFEDLGSETAAADLPFLRAIQAWAGRQAIVAEL